MCTVPFLVPLGAILLLHSQLARADCIITPLVNGQSSAEVRPGDSFDLDIVLTSDAEDQHNSAIFRLNFWTAGLIYDAYQWADPYETGTIWDDSHPFRTSLPATARPGHAHRSAQFRPHY